MKGKKWQALILGAVLLAAAGAAWYTTPCTFLRGVEPAQVKRISVFDGNRGAAFDIVDPEEIGYIVANIQEQELERDKVSVGYSGFRFRLGFYDGAGRELESFVLNSASDLRKDPFFYRCDGGLCFDYLQERTAA